VRRALDTEENDNKLGVDDFQCPSYDGGKSMLNRLEWSLAVSGRFPPTFWFADASKIVLLGCFTEGMAHGLAKTLYFQTKIYSLNGYLEVVSATQLGIRDADNQKLKPLNTLEDLNSIEGNLH
jgi:hypothetical protein